MPVQSPVLRFVLVRCSFLLLAVAFCEARLSGKHPFLPQLAKDSLNTKWTPEAAFRKAFWFQHQPQGVWLQKKTRRFLLARTRAKALFLRRPFCLPSTRQTIVYFPCERTVGVLFGGCWRSAPLRLFHFQGTEVRQRCVWFSRRWPSWLGNVFWFHRLVVRVSGWSHTCARLVGRLSEGWMRPKSMLPASSQQQRVLWTPNQCEPQPRGLSGTPGGTPMV